MAKFAAQAPLALDVFLTDASLFEFFEEAVPTTVTLNKVVATNSFDGITEQLILTGSFGAELDEDGYPTSGTITGLKFTSTEGVSFSFAGISLTVDEFVTYIEGDDLLGLVTDLLAGDDVVKGSTGDDAIYGFDGNDLMDGRSGADVMAGGAGDDLYYVDHAGDVVIELSGEGVDRIQARVDYTLGDNVENLTLKGAAAVAGTGNGLANVLRGTAGDNTLSGLGGIDELFGNDGDDTLLGGGGGDRLEGGAGRDTVSGGGGDDLIVGGTQKDTLTGGDGADTFFFGAGEVGASASSADVITDFDQAEGDRVHVRQFDANTGVGGDQNFTFIGDAAFTGVAGQLHYVHAGPNTFVEGDTDGDGTADFVIRLDGLHTLAAGDFVL